MRRAVLLVPLLLAGPAAVAQEIPASGTELVRLDVVVTDGDGKPVRDLKADDFVVLEDGKAQRVTHFVPATHVGRGRAAAAGATLAAGTEAAAPSRAPGRTIVIVVDDLHIAGTNLELVKAGLRRLLDEFAASDDEIALVTTGGGTLIQPTPQRAALRAAVNVLSSRAAVVVTAPGSQMTPAQAELILSRERNALQLAAKTLANEPGSVFDGASPQVALEAGGGAVSPAGAVDSEAKDRVAEREAQRQARSVLADALRFSAATMETIADVLRSLAPVPGRKLCLLVSDGFLMGTGTTEERTDDHRRILDAATRSGAVLYALDSRGLTTASMDAAVAGSSVPPGLQARVDRQSDQLFRKTLDGLAADTGGFLVRGTNDLADGLRRMLADNEAYYLLAYEPTNTRHDGRFRRIEVKLAQKTGLTVRTRKGYLAPDDRKRPAATMAAAAPAPAPNGAASRGSSEAEARLLLEHAPASGIPVRLTADWFHLPPGGTRAVVRAHIDVSALTWAEAAGRHQATVEIVGGLYDAEGQPVGAPFGKSADLDLGPSDYERVARAGLQYQELVTVPPGRYQVRLVAHERAGERVGSAAQWVEVPDVAAGGLAISSLFLSASAPTIGENAVAAEEALRDAHTLRRFKNGQSLYFQLYVYNPARDDKRAADVVLQAQLRGGGKLVAASRPQPAALQVKDGVPLPETNGMPLQDLAPGAYELRVVVVDRKANVTASRSVDFTVE